MILEFSSWEYSAGQLRLYSADHNKWMPWGDRVTWDISAPVNGSGANLFDRAVAGTLSLPIRASFGKIEGINGTPMTPATPPMVTIPRNIQPMRTPTGIMVMDDGRLVASYDKPEPKPKPDNRFPHVCPNCKAPAYAPFLQVECSKRGCKHWKET